jgi:hypothetical protein
MIHEAQDGFGVVVNPRRLGRGRIGAVEPWQRRSEAAPAGGDVDRLPHAHPDRKRVNQQQDVSRLRIARLQVRDAAVARCRNLRNPGHVRRQTA